MRKKVGVTVLAGLVIAVSGTAAAFALASPTDERASSTSTTVVTVATSETATPTTSPLENDVESVTTSSTQPPRVGVPPEQVLVAQQQLNDLGYWVATPDGKAGQATQQAAMAFQKVHNLPRTGILDAATLAALPTATRPASASTSGDLIEVDKKRQVIFVVRGGKTLWVFNTSTGTERTYVTNGVKGFAHTPTGTFKVLRGVDKIDPGPLGPLYRPRYITNTGIAIHGSGSIPAAPASHGCARVSNSAMDYLWANNLMPLQSSVWVYEDPAKQTFVAPTTTTTTAPTTTTAAPTTTTPPTTVPPTTPTSVTTSSTASTTSTTV